MPSPAYRLAIDLSGGLIRVVEGALGGPIRAGSGGMPAGAMVGGKIADPAGVGIALRQLLARTEITETHALVAASDTVATFRILAVPADHTDNQIAALVAKELPLDPARFDTQWLELDSSNERRMLYAAAWDRALVRALTEAVKSAGVEPTVVDLKSACIARAVPAPACAVVDLSVDPVEILLIDHHLPQVWHTVNAGASPADDLAGVVGPALRSVFRYYRRRRDSSFSASSPVFISGDQHLPDDAMASLRDAVGQPVLMLPLPARVPDHLRHATYLTCLGLMMRRSA